MTLTMPLSVFLRLLMQAILILRECLSGSALVPSGGARSRLCQHVGAWAPEALTQRRRCVWYAICSHHGWAQACSQLAGTRRGRHRGSISGEWPDTL